MCTCCTGRRAVSSSRLHRLGWCVYSLDQQTSLLCPYLSTGLRNGAIRVQARSRAWPPLLWWRASKMRCPSSSARASARAPILRIWTLLDSCLRLQAVCRSMQALSGWRPRTRGVGSTGNAARRWGEAVGCASLLLVMHLCMFYWPVPCHHWTEWALPIYMLHTFHHRSHKEESRAEQS